MTLKHKKQEIHFIHSLKDALNAFKGSHISLGDILKNIKEEGLIFLIAVISFPTSIPIPTPPGFTTLFGIPLCILTIQMIYRLQAPWLPEWIAKKEIKASTFQSFILKAEPFFNKFSIFLKPRLARFTTNAMERFVGLLAFLCAISIALPILFGNAIPSAGIFIMSMGLLYKDGLTVLIGMIISIIGIIVSTAVVVTVIFLGHGAIVKAQNFITGSIIGGTMSQQKISHGNSKANQESYPFKLPDLPYASNSLEPHMSAKTFEFHHGKHHNAYIQNLNGLVKDTDLAKASLEGIIIDTAGDKDKVAIFNNAAQVWNHTFFWYSMAPRGGGQPPKGKLLDKINEDFGSYDKFVEAFKAAGATQFGSGWAWLVYDQDADKLMVMKTANADTPIAQGKKVAIITCDVWEHAYYLDYQNRRPDYIDTFLTHLVDWEFAVHNFENATKN